MGSSGTYYSAEKLAEMERRRLERVGEADEKRRKFAKKIVTVVVDRINHEIIRPGPKPEERECYDVAHELRDLSPQLVDLVAAVIKVKEEEG